MLAQLFRRTSSAGWLILSGPSPSISERGVELLLQIVDTEQPMLVLSELPEGSTGEHPWIEELAALLDIRRETVAPASGEFFELVSSVELPQLIVATGGGSEKWMDRLAESFNHLSRGAKRDEHILYLVGRAASVIGEWWLTTEDRITKGLSWLPGSLIIQEGGDRARLEVALSVLREQPQSYVLNLVGGATLALGPGGEVELWGIPEPSITLGKGWQEL